MNNEGISLLLSGQDKVAVSRLTEALTMVRQQLNQMEAEGQSSAISSLSHITDTNPSSFHELASLPNLHDESFFIYNQTIVIPVNAPRSCSTVRIYSACIILNIALAYHRRGKARYLPALKKAEMMYEMAAQLVGNDLEILNRLSTAALVYLAAVNNLTQIHHEAGNLQRANEGVECLTFLIQNTHIHEGVLSETEINSFLLNAMLVGLKQTAPAA